MNVIERIAGHPAEHCAHDDEGGKETNEDLPLAWQKMNKSSFDAEIASFISPEHNSLISSSRTILCGNLRLGLVSAHNSSLLLKCK